MASSIANLLLKIEAQQGDATQAVDELAAALAALDKEKAEATATVETNQGAFDTLQLELDRFDHKKVEAKAGVDIKEGESQLALFTKDLEAWAGRTFKGQGLAIDEGKLTDLFAHQGQLKMDVDLDTAGAEAHAVAFHEQLQLMFDKPVEQKVDIDKSQIQETEGLITKMANAFGSLAGPAAGAGKLFQNLGENLSTVTVNFGMFGARLGPVVAGLIALAVVIGTSLVAAFIAVASSIGLAVIALGAMSIALVAAMAPVAIIAIPAMLAFSKVLQAMNSAQTDQTKAAREAATAIRQKAQADALARSFAQQHADAEQGLTDAITNAADVRKKGIQSVADAQQRLVDAQTSGSQQIADASQRVADATKSAYREMQDAINGVTDALLGLQHAQLNVEQSHLNLRKAQDDLANFRKQIGLSSAAFDAMFKNFTDVSFDPTKLNAALAAIVPPTAGGAGGDRELQLEQLILNVRDARLGEKDATERVKESEQGLTRARQDAQPFIENGIKGSQNYQKALTDLSRTQASVAKSIADSTKAVATAQATANANNLAATKGITDAQQALNRLESDHAFNLKQMHDLQKASNLETDAGRTKTEKLSAEETKLLGAIKGLIGAFQKDFGPAISGFFDGLIAGMKLLGPAMGQLKGPMTALGQVMGTAVTDFFKVLTSPGALKLFGSLVDGAKQLLPYIDKIFKPMLDILGKIAVAAMPFLVAAFKDIAGWLDGIDKKTTVNSISKWLKDIMPNLTAVVGFVIQAIPALISFMKQAGPAGIQMLTWATGVAKQFENWANSKKGRDEIHDFFTKTIPTAITFFNVIIQIAQWFIEITSFVSGAWNTWNNFWGGVGGLLFDIWDWISNIVSSDIVSTLTDIFNIISDVLTGQWVSDLGNKAIDLGVSIVEGIVNGVVQGVGDLADMFIQLFDDAWKQLKQWLGISSPSKRFFNLGKDVIQGLINGLTSLVVDFATWIWNNIIKPVVDWLVKLPVQFFNYGKDIINSLINGLISLTIDLATWIYDHVIKPVVDWLVSLATNFFNYGKDIIQGLWNGLTSIVVDVADWIWKNAIKPAVDWLVKLPTDFFNMGKNIVQSLWNGLTSIPFDFGGWVYDHIPGPLRSILNTGSPSKVMIEFGKDIVKGLQVGIDASAADLKRSVNLSIVSPVTSAGAAVIAGTSAGVGSGMVIQNQVVNLPAAPGHDQMGDPRHQAALFAREMRRRGWR